MKLSQGTIKNSVEELSEEQKLVFIESVSLFSELCDSLSKRIDKAIHEDQHDLGFSEQLWAEVARRIEGLADSIDCLLKEEDKGKPGWESIFVGKRGEFGYLRALRVCGFLIKTAAQRLNDSAAKFLFGEEDLDVVEFLSLVHVIFDAADFVYHEHHCWKHPGLKLALPIPAGVN